MSKNSNRVNSGQSYWDYNGQKRPDFAHKPEKGQESVWDYTRPPKLLSDTREVLVIFANKIIARSTQAIRVLETGKPPSFYIPPTDVNMQFLKKAFGEFRCEWKGEAIFWDVIVEQEKAQRAAWSYPKPNPDYHKIKSFLAFFPDKAHCYVDGEHVKPQPETFHGGWMTKEIVGPIKS